MPTSPLNRVIQHFLADFGPDGGGMTDAELLARFVSSRDEGALAALVRRHAPMVWGVCRRLLPNHHDAEDAFQATFLVLVRKAADVPRQAVPNWLYGVARQTAVRLRATAAKRGRRETQVVNMPEPAVPEVRDTDLQSVVDEELCRLPGHYRGVLVLCDLEGATRKEAARQLGIPEGSVASRLARARVMLAKRLNRRGVALSGGSVAALSAGSASASAPPALVASTIRAASLLAAGRAAGIVSAKVAALTEGVVRAMFLAKLKTVTWALALAVLVGLGSVALVPGSGHAPAAGAAPAPQKGGDAKPDAAKLVRQLGSPSYAKRQAAHKALHDMGARAAAWVRAGMGDADPEVARRCAAIWTRWRKEKLRVLIAKVLAAHGGEAKLKKLQFTLTVKHSNGETQHYFVRPPKSFRWETRYSPPRDPTTRRICILLPQGRMWWWKRKKEKAVPFFYTGIEPPMEYWLDYVKFFGPRRVLRLKDADHKVALLDEEAKISDRAAVGVEVTGPRFKAKMYFDKRTHLLAKQEGGTYYSPIYFSDYKKFDGIPIARKEKDGYFNGVVTGFRAVAKFDAKLFAQP
jgi:RNA polymerase sigma factor (sigma-70 family)